MTLKIMAGRPKNPDWKKIATVTAFAAIAAAAAPLTDTQIAHQKCLMDGRQDTENAEEADPSNQDPARSKSAEATKSKRGEVTDEARFRVALLTDGDPYIRAHARIKLREMGPTALPALLEAIEGDDAEFAKSARGALARIASENKQIREDPEVPPILIEGLGDARDQVRSDSGDALVKLGASAIAPLTEALGKAQQSTKAEIHYVIMRIANEDEKALLQKDAVIPVALTALNANEWVTRKAAAEALGKMGDVKVLPALVRTLEDKDELVVLAAAEAVGEIRKRDPNSKEIGELVSAQVRKLEDKQPEIQKKAAHLLAVIGDQKALPQLRKMNEESQDEEVKAATSEAINLITNP